MEEKEKLNYENALKLLNELRVLEGKYKMRNGNTIIKFFAISTDYYKECEDNIGFENLWNEKYHNENRDLDYDIVALNKIEFGAFWKDNDIEYFKELLLLHQKNK